MNLNSSLASTCFRTSKKSNNRKKTSVIIGRRYRLLLNVCEMIHSSWMVDEKTGSYRFQELSETMKEWLVSSGFYLRLLQAREPEFRITRETFRWRGESDSQASLNLLPITQTDVSINTDTRHISLSGHDDIKKLHIEQLYRLFSYLMKKTSQ
jgi:hypothetical protein